MEIEIKNHQGGKYQERGFLFLKQDLRKILTTNPLMGITNTKTVVVYNKGTPLKTVYDSLELLMNEVAFKIAEEERKSKALEEEAAKPLFASYDIQNARGTVKVLKRKTDAELQ